MHEVDFSFFFSSEKSLFKQQNPAHLAYLKSASYESMINVKSCARMKSKD